MLEIARRLPERQLMAICGHNARAARPPGSPGSPRAHVRRGFHARNPALHATRRLLHRQARTGQLSEAMAMRLPVIVESNAWTLPQERYNAEWVREHGAGIVLPNFRGIARAVEELLIPTPVRVPHGHGTAAQPRGVRNPGHSGEHPRRGPTVSLK